MSLRVLVTGANGFIGQPTCNALLRADMSITAAIRDTRRNSVPGCRNVEIANIDGATHWDEALRGVEAVVHLAARTHSTDAAGDIALYHRLNVDGTKCLAAAARKKGVRRFVYISSVKVNSEVSQMGADGRLRYWSGEDPPCPTTPYGRSKWEAEKLLNEGVESGRMSVITLRPPLVYGPGQKANIMRLTSAIERGIPLPFSHSTNLRSLIYVENLASAIVRAVECDGAGARTYTLADLEVSTGDLIKAIALALDKPARLFPLPVGILKCLATLVGRRATVDRLTESLVVERQQFRDELDWSPPCSFEEALRTTANWYRSQEN